MIRVEDLSVTLDGRPILDGVDVTIERGEAVALVGPNGAGKTTLLRCLLGLVRYAGSIAIDGIDVADDPVAAKRLIGFMPQTPVFCEESARGSLAFLARLRGAPISEVDLRIERVGLSAHANRAVRTFSVGMRQRLSLAAALIGDPPVLVLDEPTASIDLKGQQEVVALLRSLSEEGRTLVLSSHRAEEVRALVNRTVLMDEGRVVDSRPTSELSLVVPSGRSAGTRLPKRGGAVRGPCE